MYGFKIIAKPFLIRFNSSRSAVVMLDNSFTIVLKLQMLYIKIDQFLKQVHM